MAIGSFKPRVPFFTSLLRYNVSAGTATAADYSVFSLCNYSNIIGFGPVLSTFIGAVAGAMVAFVLARNWTFLNKEDKVSSQSMKFLPVVGGSMLLNTFGMYIATNYLGIGEYLNQNLLSFVDRDLIHRILVSVTVGLGYNFPLQRYFVFR